MNHEQTIDPASYPATQKQLGLCYSRERSAFRVWAPTQQSVRLALYEQANAVRRRLIDMEKQPDGTFETCVSGDLHGQFYNYLVDGQEVTDPYSISSTKNSAKSAIVDLSRTDPEGFREGGYCAVHPSDAVLYEVHIGDFTQDPSSENFFRGKYLAFTQNHTEHRGMTTGLSHLKELGVTHLHIMPMYDFLSTDELSEEDDNYNWGYDPELYNVPEGTYSVDPEDPVLRIAELKRMVHNIHRQGMGVVMDVVYNHTYRSKYSNFNVLVPGYYYRTDGVDFSNGSGCGNEFASEREMGRRFIIDSLLYWQREYHIDGFRFDLMALIDRQTVQEAVKRLREINPNTIIYGEPWSGGVTSLPVSQQTLWSAQNDMDIALFNERFRNALRGDNDGAFPGFVQGRVDERMSIETGLCGSIDYDAAHKGTLRDPCGTINYFNAHDNLIFEDKLLRSTKPAQRRDLMTKLAFGLLFTAQGIPFFHAGNEFRRSKKMNANSYNAPYSVNAIDWNKKKEEEALVHYVRDLIEVRREFSVFRMKTGEEIRRRMHFLESGSEHVISVFYEQSEQEGILVFHNSAGTEKWCDLSVLRECIAADTIHVRKLFGTEGRIRSNRQSLHLEQGQQRLMLLPISTTMYTVRWSNEGVSEG